ncbi:MAG: RNA polymerase sigma factor [Actinomycetota bacterium]
MSSEMDTTGLDEVVIREFLATDNPRLVAAVALTAGSRAAAEDAVAEALARAWERSDRGESIGSLPAWVMRVALNLTHSRWRRLAVERRVRPRLADTPDPAPEDDRIDIERALATLSRREREAIVLRYYIGFDVAGAAEALGVSEGTVKTLLFRGRRAIARALGEDEPEEVDDGARLR